MTVANEYGRALFLLSEEEGNTELVKCDLSVALGAFVQNPEYAKMLDTPAIAKAEKTELADKAFSSLCESVCNLIKILSEHHCVSALPDVCKTFISLYNEKMGIEEVEAVTAVEMTEKQLSAMKEKLEKQTGKKIIIRNTVDASILGGVKLRYEGKQIDGSVKTRLDGFAQTLRDTVI